MEVKYKSFDGKYYNTIKERKEADLKWAIDGGYLIFIDYEDNNKEISSDLFSGFSSGYYAKTNYGYFKVAKSKKELMALLMRLQKEKNYGA